MQKKMIQKANQLDEVVDNDFDPFAGNQHLREVPAVQQPRT